MGLNSVTPPMIQKCQPNSKKLRATITSEQIVIKQTILKSAF